MKCKRCGFDNPDYLEYCQNCTAPLESKKGDNDKEPTWGFVKAPKWEDPEFSADTVSDNDVPSDYVHQGRHAAGTVAAAAAAAAAANKAAGRRVKETRKAVEDELDLLDDEFDDELDELEDDFDEELDDDFDDDFDDDLNERRHARSSKKAAPFAFLGKLKKPKKSSGRRGGYDDELYDEELGEDDGYEHDDYSEYKGKRSPDLKPIIKIVGAVAALAVLALIVWLIVRAASGCAKPKEYGAPVVEHSAVDSTADDEVYYITVPAAKGTKLVYVTSGGSRYDTVVGDAEYAKFKITDKALLPNEPIEGDTYSAMPQIFVIKDDGTEEQIKLDPIDITAGVLGITYENESTDITSQDGKVEIKGRIQVLEDYNAKTELTMNGESVEIGPDGCFAKEFLYETPGAYTIEVEAKLPNYRIEKRTYNVTVEEKAVETSAFIQMPWDYGDTQYAQRVKSSSESVDVKGKVPEGAKLTASCASSNASLTTPVVNSDGSFSFTVTMRTAGDYTIKLTCTTAQGNTLEKEIHVQRQPDYAQYKNEAKPADYAGFQRGDGTKYKISGKITEILKEGDYYLAKFQMTDGNTIIIEYHPHYGSGRELKLGDTFNEMYGRSWGPYPSDSEYAGTINFYVWFIEG